jgi:uncharacterized protein
LREKLTGADPVDRHINGVLRFDEHSELRARLHPRGVHLRHDFVEDGAVGRGAVVAYCNPSSPNWNTFQFCRRTRYAGRVSASTQPAIDGWFATDGSGEPYLIGGKCHHCGTFVFPPRANNCPNPACEGDELAQVPLSRRGTLWSYTENRYAPPPPYPSPDPFEPFAVAAVQLADEGLIVLGKVVEGTLAADLKVGMEMELTTMPLFVDDDGVERVVYAWRIAS